MPSTKSEQTAKTWSQSALHSKWESVYRADDNIAFYHLALQAVFSQCGISAGDLRILDAGCGSGAKSLLLARQGFRVAGIDVSPEMLRLANEKAQAEGLQDRAQFQIGNLTALEFENGAFDCVLCWGVLMHVPDIESALSEMARVLKPGGFFILSEGNQSSLQAKATGWIKALRPRGNERIEQEPQGVESWIETPDGLFLTRQADIRWLKQRLKQEDCETIVHRAGEFTEWHTRVASPMIRKAMHAWNAFWFRRIRLAAPAFGNLIAAKKKA